jgi:hypothetical protein
MSRKTTTSIVLSWDSVSTYCAVLNEWHAEKTAEVIIQIILSFRRRYFPHKSVKVIKDGACHDLYNAFFSGAGAGHKHHSLGEVRMDNALKSARILS